MEITKTMNQTNEEMEASVNNMAKGKYKISARIVEREMGVKEFSDIKMIRLISNDHNLLIMEDFMPVIGEVCGKVELVFDDAVETFEPIHGFYMHKANRFSLIIENRTGVVPAPLYHLEETNA